MGRMLVTLTEVELGVGRPDVLVLSCSRNRVEWLARNELRLRSLSEARVLSAALQPNGREVWERAGLTRSHTVRLLRSLEMRGWLASTMRHRALEAAPDALVIEAKVFSWRRGLVQLAQTRRMTQRGALLVPQDAARLIDRRVLKKYDVGLLAHSESGTISWIRSSPSRPTSLAARLWMGEWSVRGLYGPASYMTPSSRENSLRAVRMLPSEET